MKRAFQLMAMTVCVGTTFVLPARVFAGVVTIVASGNVDFVSQPPLNPLLGREMIVTAVYTTNVTDTNPDPNLAIYLDGLISFVATLDGQPLTGPSATNSNIEVGNDLGDPFFDTFGAIEFHEGLAVSFPGDGLGPYDRATTALVLRDVESLAFTDTSMPMSFNLAEMDLQFITTNLQPQTNDFNTRVDATIRSFSITFDPIPEPATLLLLAVGFAGAAFSRRRWNVGDESG